jgi:CubicO group peptidase (beta-lactamase class C family)
MTRPAPRTLAALLALALLVTTPLPSAANEEQVQERIALAWVAAHNAADVDAMADLRAKHFKRSEVKNWQDNFLNLIDRFGTFEVYAIMFTGSGRMMVGVNPEKVDERLRLVFEFFEDEPDQVSQIGLDAGDGMGEDDSLPALDLEGGWEARKPAIDEYLEELASEGVFSGTVLIADHDKIHFEGAYGLASREFEVANTLDTRFDVGSCTKDFTHTAILQLQAQGKLSVDDRVGKHLPSYPNEQVREQVTIQHLLDHRSGLGDYFTEEWHQTPMSSLRHVEDYIPIWGPKALLSAPGEREAYSNYGYTVLGAIIETVSGQRYPDYVVEHIFTPAGMVDSGFFETDAVVPNIAVGYTYMSPTGRLEQPVKNIYVEPAKGGPWGKSFSTIRDLYRYYAAMMNGEIVAGEDNWLAGAWENAALALGGAGPGLNTLISLEEGIMVVVMANMDPPIAESVAMKLSRAVRQ